MRKGFTLIELVMVILILGLLAVVAIPKFYDLSSRAQEAAELGVVGGVRAGIHAYYANFSTWPASLDSAAAGDCSGTNVCFDTILAQGGIRQDWSKDAGGNYIGPNGGNYTYTAGSGSFLAN